MIDVFLNQPFLAQFFVSFIGLFFFFVFIIELKMFCLRLAKHGGAWVPVAKFIFYPFALFFLACDIGFNIVYAPFLFKLEMANKHGEGWTLTSRLKWHLRNSSAWNFRVADFICERFIEPVDPGHCLW